MLELGVLEFSYNLSTQEADAGELGPDWEVFEEINKRKCVWWEPEKRKKPVLLVGEEGTGLIQPETWHLRLDSL